MQGASHNRVISMNFTDAKLADRWQFHLTAAVPIVNKQGYKSPEACACAPLCVRHNNLSPSLLPFERRCWFLFTSFRSAFLGKKMLKNDQVLAIVEIDWTTWLNRLCFGYCSDYFGPNPKPPSSQLEETARPSGQVVDHIPRRHPLFLLEELSH